MSTTVYEVLDELQAQAASSADKGSNFEKLMVKRLRTDPLYAGQVSEVWPWSTWPGNGGQLDTGIDIVAVDRVTGKDVAIQCKFYDRKHQISKGDIDSFPSPSGKESFGKRIIIISTTDKWNWHTRGAIKGQQMSETE